jgi:hypothetical protein
VLCHFPRSDYLNPAEILAGATPALQEVGPFTYKQYKKVIDANWTDDGAVMYYKQWTYFVFQPALSVADPTTVNITGGECPALCVVLWAQVCNVQWTDWSCRVASMGLSVVNMPFVGLRAVFIHPENKQINVTDLLPPAFPCPMPPLMWWRCVAVWRLVSFLRTCSACTPTLSPKCRSTGRRGRCTSM